ncbi:selenite/tellurite reduction operon rhodanese-like protein ExtH [Trichlorobacter lovleyi]|uniref:selenite/tellurite reduction operon rhodanese-like protein ExtH n=1 Tax=Trichlorobacter lovleyi TaxID=313985 RepID=UPI0023F128CA|nr:selenite/tellurite reduction operon rhodanese-like protein ExtH [Trichlorobacter lovleyi]
MMQRFVMTRRSMLFSLLGLILTALLTAWGCGSGGSGSYTDPNSLITTTKATTIVGAAQLKAWIDEGKLNATFGSKDRVVIVSPSTDTDWYVKGHIPGAVRWDTSELAENGRTEGVSIAASMMPSGAMMDGIIKRLGIDENTTIVISLPKSSTLYYQTLIYWDLRYWGFPKERIKILNGGDDAWEVAGYDISKDPTDRYTSSTYSVAYNSGLKTGLRYNVGQVIAKIDETIADPTVLNSWQIIDVRGFKPSPTAAGEFYLTNALRMTSYTQFFPNSVNNEATRNKLFPTKAQLESLFQTSKIYLPSDVSGTPTGTISTSKKTIVTCTASSSASPSFALFDAVLDVPDGQITMYDGSATQWNYYSYALLKAKYTTATDAQIYAWAFDNPANLRAQGTFPTTIPSSANFSFNAANLANGPGVAGMTDQIDRGNQAYIDFIKLNSNTNQNTGTGGSQQGC